MNARLMIFGRLVPVVWMIVAVASLALVGAKRTDAQVVQLPTIQTFSYSGSVLVPYGGTSSLGGVSRSGWSTSRRGFGPFSQSRSGGFASSSVLSASATIIDLDAMDRAIGGVDRRSTAVDRSEPVGKPVSMVQEGKRLVRYARRRRSEGDHEMARIGYELAITKLDGELLRYAVAEYRTAYPRH